MALYLVQHGKCVSKEVDPDRPLSEEGRSETQRVADSAKAQGLQVSLIRHSGKTRAAQTAEIFADALGPAKGVEKADGLKPMDDTAAYAGKIDAGEDLMLVGHLPFMEKLVSYLVTGSADRPVIRFRNSGIVALDKDPDPGSWVIRWTLIPGLKG